VPLTINSGVVAAFNLELDRGVLAVQVESTKLMGQFGVQSGDIITSVNNTDVSFANDIAKVVGQSSKSGRKSVLLQLSTEDGARFVALPIAKG
jgi:serine protease Do